MKKKIKLLILGDTGFVGSNIKKTLLSSSIVKIFTIKKIDLRNIDNLYSFFKKKKFDYIINAAAHVGSVHYVSKHAADVFSDNILIDTNLYKVINEYNSKAIIVNIIANCIYPHKLKIQKENNWNLGPVHPSVLPFASAKRNLKILTELYYSQYKFKSINLVCPSLYGPGDHLNPNKTHALNGMIIRMLHNKSEKIKNFDLWGNGKTRREWLYIEDLSKIIFLILKNKIKFLPILNIAQNKSYSILALARIISDKLNYRMKYIRSNNYQKVHNFRQLDNHLFNKIFKNFKFLNIETGIKNSIDYYKRKSLVN
jgi:GDP-L-fucose synthase